MDGGVIYIYKGVGSITSTNNTFSSNLAERDAACLFLYGVGRQLLLQNSLYTGN
jgi:hypothetical protein